MDVQVTEVNASCTQEACGRYAEATAAYQLLIDQTPLNAVGNRCKCRDRPCVAISLEVCFVGNALPQMALKRLICISKAEGNLSEAITRLNTYVRQFAGDIAAVWYLASVRLLKTCNALSDVILLRCFCGVTGIR